jgi:hypothetical protein
MNSFFDGELHIFDLDINSLVQSARKDTILLSKDNAAARRRRRGVFYIR